MLFIFFTGERLKAREVKWSKVIQLLRSRAEIQT